MALRDRTIAGIVLSVVWVVFTLLLLFAWRVEPAGIDELADYVAGMVVAPLAFLWLILGYYQQGDELKENTAALLGQQREMEKQASVMTDQATALRTAAESLLEHTRPYVTAFFLIEGYRILIVFQNVGSRPAKDVRFDFDPPLKEIGDPGLGLEGFLVQSFMPPGYELRNYFNDTVRYFSDSRSFSISTKATITYSDLRGVHYREEYEIGVSQAAEQIMQPWSTETSLGEIARYMKDIDKKFEKLLRQQKNGS